MNSSLKEILRIGEELYFNEFKNELEANFYGQYFAIDIEDKDYVVAEKEIDAIDKAEEKFGDKLFYIGKVGRIARPMNNRELEHALQF